MSNMIIVRFLTFSRLMLLLAFTVTDGSQLLAGTFQTKCLERHFWFSVKYGFLSSKFHFGFEDQNGLQFLSDGELALCGYTVLITDAGDLVFRASFLACHVKIKGESNAYLQLWFVNQQEEGPTFAHPVQLRCPLQVQWATREIVCEENYMEVSIQPLLSVRDKTDKMGLVDTVIGVMFHRTNLSPAESRALSLTEAAALGYQVSQRGSHLILRCPYSSPRAFHVKEKGWDIEVVQAAVLYGLQGNIWAVNTTVACPLSEATSEGSDLLWTTPYVLTPLVHGQVTFRGVRFALVGEALSESDVKKREYDIRLHEGQVEIKIPPGASGCHIKSGVLMGKYSQSMSADVFLVSEWEDQLWPVTQHRILRLLKTPLIPRTLVFTQNSSQELFSGTLGLFMPDVSLKKVTVKGGGDVLTWTTNHRTDLNLSKLSHPNGNHYYQLTFPFSNPQIIPEYIGGGHKTYSLSFTFTLSISPSGENFYHQASIEHTVEYMASSSLRLEGKCTESSLLVLLHHRPLDELEWELFLGGHMLDNKRVKMGGLMLDAKEDHVSIEIPLFSPSIYYELLSLRGLVARVEVSVKDSETLKIHDRLVHRCTFPAQELIVCLPQGRIVALVDTTHTIPPTQPNRTTLLDTSCVPMETDSARALFIFSLDSCGTTVTTDGNFLIYENQISYPRDFLPSDSPVIHRDSPYRLTIQCRYPANDNASARAPLELS